MAVEGICGFLCGGASRGRGPQQHKSASGAGVTAAAASAGMLKHHKDLVYRTEGAENSRQLGICGAWRDAMHLQGYGRLGGGCAGRGSRRRRRCCHPAASRRRCYLLCGPPLADRHAGLARGEERCAWVLRPESAEENRWLRRAVQGMCRG